MLVLALAALAFAASVSFAGECPADKRVADGQGQKPGATAPVSIAFGTWPTYRGAMLELRAGTAAPAEVRRTLADMRTFAHALRDGQVRRTER